MKCYQTSSLCIIRKSPTSMACSYPPPPRWPIQSAATAPSRWSSTPRLLARGLNSPSFPARIRGAARAAAFATERLAPGARRGGESTTCPCCVGFSKRRLLLGSSSALLHVLPSAAGGSSGGPPSDPAATLEMVHPARPEWYEKLYAKLLAEGTKKYEAEVALYKEKIFSNLTDKSKNVLELGVGTGPNFRYYVRAADQYVVGVDPNKQMEKYARASAEAAGLQSENFRFIRGVGESIDVSDNSVDAVVGTIVLCSVNDVALTLREIKRVLKPGGLYFFIEHVAARDGSFLRFVQGVLDPLQQFVADNCHLARDTGKQITEAGFSNVDLHTAVLSSVSIVSPHIYGVACK